MEGKEGFWCEKNLSLDDQENDNVIYVLELVIRKDSSNGV